MKLLSVYVKNEAESRGKLPTIRPWVLVAATLGLFAVWSNSFVAVIYLLGNEIASRQLDWRALTVARFLPAGAALLICGDRR